MSPTMKRAWTLFAAEANWTGLHPLDLKRFALVVRAAHHPARRSTPGNFERLVAEAAPWLDAQELSDYAARPDELYDFGRQVCSAHSAWGLMLRIRQDAEAC